MSEKKPAHRPVFSVRQAQQTSVVAAATAVAATAGAWLHRARFIDDGIAAIGSGGMYALAAAKALKANTDLKATQIAEKALRIAGDICVFTNGNITVEEV